jgi:hypothetical protein
MSAIRTAPTQRHLDCGGDGAVVYNAISTAAGALWLVPERHTGEDNLECDAPLVLLPGATVTVGKKDVDKGDKKLSKLLFRCEGCASRGWGVHTCPCSRLLTGARSCVACGRGCAGL